MACPHCRTGSNESHFRRDFPDTTTLETHLKQEWAHKSNWLALIPAQLAWKRTDLDVVRDYDMFYGHLPPEIRPRPPL